MKNTILLVAIALFLITLNSCTDESGTNPSDEFVGATFKIENEDVSEMELFYVNNGVKTRAAYYESFHLFNSQRVRYGKDSFRYLLADYKKEFHKSDRNYISVNDQGMYFLQTDGGQDDNEFIKYFPILENYWLKHIDFKNEEWSGLDLEIDSIIDGDRRLRIGFKNYGSKIEDLKIEYNGTKYNATKYRFEFKYFLFYNDTTIVNNHTITDYTIADQLDIYSIEGFNPDNEMIYCNILVNKN